MRPIIIFQFSNHESFEKKQIFSLLFLFLALDLRQTKKQEWEEKQLTSAISNRLNLYQICLKKGTYLYLYRENEFENNFVC
jgi:hypothetical protein